MLNASRVALHRRGRRANGPGHPRPWASRVLECRGSRSCELSAVGVDDSEHRHVDVVVSDEVENLVGWHVRAEVVDVPVVLAQRDGGHRGGQRMTVTCNCGNDSSPTSASAGVRSNVSENPLRRGGGPVLDPNRELTVVPRLADPAQCRSDDLLDQFGDRRPFADDGAGKRSSRRFVTIDQSAVCIFVAADCSLFALGADGFDGCRLRSMNAASSSGSIWYRPLTTVAGRRPFRTHR